MASLNTLPDDLLLCIVERAVEQASVPPSFIDGSHVWALAHVFSRLRSLVIYTPQLWSKVVITVGPHADVVERPIKIILERAQTRPIDLHLVWSLADRPLTDPTPQTLDLRHIISAHCAPFSGRIARLAMLFDSIDDHDDFSIHARLPNEFFHGLPELHLGFSSKLQPSTLRVNPIFDGRLFDGIASPKVTVQTHARQSQIIGGSVRSSDDHHTAHEPAWNGVDHTNLCEPIRLSFATFPPNTSSLSLIGPGLIHTPLETSILLRSVPQLESFEGWVSNARSRFTSSRKLEMPNMKSLNLTICEESEELTKTLAEMLSILVMPASPQLTVRHYLNGVVKDVYPDGNCWEERILDVQRTNKTYLEQPPAILAGNPSSTFLGSGDKRAFTLDTSTQLQFFE